MDALSASTSGDAVARFFASGHSPDRRGEALLFNPRKPDLLNLLLAARDPETGRSMSDDEIVANLLTFITAGHETTAVALTWTLWLLAKDQATQQRVFEEVRSVAGDQTIDATHVEGLSFCRQVIQEAMRLFPPAPGIARISKDCNENRRHAVPRTHTYPHSCFRAASQRRSLGQSQCIRSRSLCAGSG